MAQLLARVRSRRNVRKDAPAIDAPALDTPQAVCDEVLQLSSPSLTWHWPFSMRNYFLQSLRYRSTLVVHDAAVDTRMFVFGTMVEHLLAEKQRLLRGGGGGGGGGLVQLVAPNKTIAQRACLSLTLALNYQLLHEKHRLRATEQRPDSMRFVCGDALSVRVRFCVPSQLEPASAGGSLVALGAEMLFANSLFVRGALESRLSFDTDAHVTALFGVTAAVPASASFAYRAHPKIFMPLTESHGTDERKFSRLACSGLALADVRMYAELVCVPLEESRIDPHGGARRRAGRDPLSRGRCSAWA
jgi:hypothetical protein